MPGQKGGGAGEAIAQGQRGNRELIPDPPAKYSAWGKHHSQHPHTVLKPPPRREADDGDLPPSGVPPGMLRMGTPPCCCPTSPRCPT